MAPIRYENSSKTLIETIYNSIKKHQNQDKNPMKHARLLHWKLENTIYKNYRCPDQTMGCPVHGLGASGCGGGKMERSASQNPQKGAYGVLTGVNWTCRPGKWVRAWTGT